MTHTNSVELLGYYGSDEVIACSAWTSTSRNLTEEKRGRIATMIHKLWTSGHETPFEKGVVHFLVNTDIATHIQFLKHRISSFNGESARYKELKEDKYYLPSDWEIQTVKESLGVYSEGINGISCKLKYEPGNTTWYDILKWYNDLGNFFYHQSLKELTETLGRKRAKESCRFFKTYNSQIQGDVMFNMRSFANFQKLRNSEHAQVEIKDLASQMLSLVSNIEGNPFKHTLNAMSHES